MWLLTWRLRKLAELVAQRDFASIMRRLRRQLWSDKQAILLRRDLSDEVEPPAMPVAFVVRPYEPGDAARLFDAASPEDDAERQKLESWLRQGLERCYVAELPDKRVTFLQWLCTNRESQLLHVVSGGELTVEEPGSVMLEGAYTPQRFRRLPVMPAAMARIAEEGRRQSARWALVSVDAANASMIRAARHAGFAPWQLVRYRRRLFRLHISRSVLPA
jgi:hypothetical protein